VIVTTPKGSRRCRRCSGSGEFAHGACFNCHGAGFTTPTAKTPPRHNVTAARRTAVIDAIRTRATELDGFRNGPIETETSWARSLLEDNEPARFERLVTSVEADRLDDVITALRAYHHANTGEFHHGELVAWTCTDVDDDGDERTSTWNGFVDSYAGMIDDEPHWIVNRNGALHHVPERLMGRI
jgi:hypothetical protein